MKIYCPNRIKFFFLLLVLLVVIDKDCPAKSISESILSKQEKITRPQEGEDSSQSTDEPQPSLPERDKAIKSMGLPKVWKPYAGLMSDWDRRGDREVGGEILAGIYKDLLNPVYAALGFAGEGYFRIVGGDADGGVRLMGASPFFGLQAGGDYSIRDNEVDFILSLSLPPHRGGLFSKGWQLRADYFPGRDHSFNFGVTVPLLQPWHGKTRPKSDNVRLPRASRHKGPEYSYSFELEETLVNLRHAADWINRFTTPFFDEDAKTNEAQMAAFLRRLNEFKDHIRLKDGHYPDGHTFDAEIAVYHNEMERAFSIASGIKGENNDEYASGKLIADKARQILLDKVILPYNRLFGQRKTRDSLFGFGFQAGETFESWVESYSGISPTNRQAVIYVFKKLIEYMDENRRASKKIWGDSRLVWIPLHYSLRPEDHDTQRELDVILERAVGEEFVDANDVHYVINEQFQIENARMVLSARDYHVLWIHDYKGQSGAGNPDEIGFRQTVDVYLRALTERVRDYERTGKIPVYMVFLDQYFFEISDSRLWMKLLENPLEHRVHLPSKFRIWEERIHRAQDELREAVEQSPMLQAGLRRYGKGWLTNQIKVHVYITNPVDLSFRSSRLFDYVPLVPDTVMRDHRKISFYDVTELDPGKGEAIYTGLGIGEHYLGPNWDDRAILVRGPVLVSLKNSARELLLSQGFNKSDIPPPLRALPKPDNYDDMANELQSKGWDATVLQVHNATGYGQKPVNVTKATLYNLMPKGSHLYIPDSLWNSPLWGGMLVGAALRGCKVFVISPAFENAPSDGFPQISRANEIFTRFVVIQNLMRPEIESAGGMFRTGIYNRSVAVGDILSKIQAFNNEISQTEWFRTVFPFDPSVYETIAGMPEFLRSHGYKPSYLTRNVEYGIPKLHFKTQFFASGHSLSTLIPLEEWAPLMRGYVIARAKQTANSETYADVREFSESLQDHIIRLQDSWKSKLSPKDQERALFYLITGSQNQDYRGMIMDGEAMVIVPNTDAMIAYLDFFWLMGLTTWVDDLEELRQLLPEYSGFKRWLGRFIRYAL